jgi:hypothetical protein
VHRALPPWILPERVGSQPRARPPAATPPQVRAGVTPRVELSVRRRRQRQAAQPRLHPPQSTPARQAASVRRETAARVSVGAERQHVRPPSRALQRTAHQPAAARQQTDPDRLLGPSWEIRHHLQQIARRRASAPLPRRKQPETHRVAKDWVGRRRPSPHPLGPRLVGQRRQCQDRLEWDLSRLGCPGWPRRDLRPPAWRDRPRRDRAGRRSSPLPPWRSRPWTPEH